MQNLAIRFSMLIFVYALYKQCLSPDRLLVHGGYVGSFREQPQLFLNILFKNEMVESKSDVATCAERPGTENLVAVVQARCLQHYRPSATTTGCTSLDQI
jgi:hypothetical protein